MDVSAALGATSVPVDTNGPKVYHLPAWDGYADPKRLDVISRIAKMRGRDPKIATLAVNILKQAGAQPRQYKKQAAALLNFVQNKIYYVNEPGERLQDPLYTLKVGYGDCDDLVIMLASLLESIRIPWKLVISGTKGRKKVRYHQGDKFPGAAKKGYNWSHIYMMIGDRPFVPQKWYYAETTVRGAPLGWDVVDGDASIFPELQNNYGAAMYGMDYNLHSIAEEPDPGPSGSTSSGGMTALFQPLVIPDLKAPGGSSIQVTPDFQVPGLNLAPGVIPKGFDRGGYRRRRYHPWRRKGLMPVAQGEQEANMVAVVVIGPEGRVLALHRSPSVRWMPGRWDLPGGKTGGRPARQAAMQILAAETGLKVDPRRLRACSAVYHPAAGTSVFYVLRLRSKREINVKAMEHQGFRFVNRRDLMRNYRTAPYVQIAFRACFKPQSLSTYTKMKPLSPSVKKGLILTPSVSKSVLANQNNVLDLLNGNLNQANVANLNGYGAMEMLQGEMYGIPKWALLAGAAGAGYYFFVHKKKKPARKRRANPRKRRRNTRKSRL